MSVSFDLRTTHAIVSLSERFFEEIRSKCQVQRLHLHNQRQILFANRTKRLAREAIQKDKLRELYSSLGLAELVERDNRERDRTSNDSRVIG
jgi:hypothetical protein